MGGVYLARHRFLLETLCSQVYPARVGQRPQEPRSLMARKAGEMPNHLLQPLGVSGPVVADELGREGTQGFAFIDRPSASSVAEIALPDWLTEFFPRCGLCPGLRFASRIARVGPTTRRELYCPVRWASVVDFMRVSRAPSVRARSRPAETGPGPPRFGHHFDRHSKHLSNSATRTTGQEEPRAAEVSTMARDE